jgi:hypothetical protein
MKTFNFIFVFYLNYILLDLIIHSNTIRIKDTSYIKTKSFEFINYNFPIYESRGIYFHNLISDDFKTIIKCLKKIIK